jgi:hypothetical protein
MSPVVLRSTAAPSGRAASATSTVARVLRLASEHAGRYAAADEGPVVFFANNGLS